MSPMGFLNRILNRPSHEKPFLLLVVGHPAIDARVPDIAKIARGNQLICAADRRVVSGEYRQVSVIAGTGDAEARVSSPVTERFLYGGHSLVRLIGASYEDNNQVRSGSKKLLTALLPRYCFYFIDETVRSQPVVR